MWYLERNKIIENTQSGFRQNRSTTDNLAKLENGINITIDNKKHTIVVFFYLQKAYGIAWRYGVIKKLNSWGVGGNLLMYIKNFLTDRKITVRVGNTYSDTVESAEGIPQGSVLSCTLFMVAIDGIGKELPPGVSSVLYVDDYAIYTSGSMPHMIERRLQVALNGLQRWCNRIGFKFSLSKTVAMHICKKQNYPKLAHNLDLYNRNIKCVDEKKFLGMTIDNRLSWSKHITNVKISCQKKLDILKHLSYKDWGADRKSLLRLYIMLIKPKIDYGCEAYSSACNSTLEKLDPIQNAAIRLGLG